MNLYKDKTGTLTEDKIDISGFLPAILEYKNKNKLISELVFKEEISLKELTNSHKTYWKNFCKYNSHKYKDTNSKEYFEEILDHPSNISIYFAECLFTCNNLDRINNTYYGSSLDKKIYDENLWILKPRKVFGNLTYDKRVINKNNFFFNNLDNDYDKNKNNKDKDKKIQSGNPVDTYIPNIHNINSIRKKFTASRRGNAINKSESFDYEIYPKYFHKITENLKMNDRENIFFDKYYKLGIIKRYDNVNIFQTLSVVVKSFFDNSIRYYIKGAPEKIFKLCKERSLPKNYHERLIEMTKVKNKAFKYFIFFLEIFFLKFFS
jgi:magnesium-transporting ATPase (P-type)